MSARERLQALDDRYTARGPLALFREVPQLAGLLVAVVFAVGSGVVLARSSDEGETGGGVSRPDISTPRGPQVLGPAIGEDVLGYYSEVNALLARAAETEPGSSSPALVTLGVSITSAQARELTAGLQVNRVYLRAGQARRPETVSVTIQDLGPDLRTAYAAIIARKGTELQAAQRLATSIDPDGLPEDRAAADDDVRVIAAERQAYAQACGCVMAMVVTSTPPLLVELLETGVVTAVELVRTDAPLADITIRPLPPQAAVTGVVAELPAAPGAAAE